MTSLIDEFILDLGSFTTKYGICADEIPNEFHSISGKYQVDHIC